MLTLSEIKTWVGISGDSSDELLSSCIIAADADLRGKVGDYDILDTGLQELAKQYMRYWIGINYADRLGELNNKESSAMSQQMRNDVFILRQAVGVAENEADTG